MIRTQSPTTLKFKVHRREPELISPAKPTPHEFKPLSDLDDRESLRFHLPGIFGYPYNPSLKVVDPVKVIKEAVAKALVFYYPYAGRLREGPKRKLIVECTGEGVLFIEADADVTLEQLGTYPLAPPFPCIDELLFDVPGSSGTLNCPLVLIQVTRLKCGGVIFGYRYNHTMSDAAGSFQFVSAISEMAREAIAPSVLPKWERHVLCARNPPQITYPHPEFNPLPNVNTKKMLSFDQDSSLCFQTFFFGPTELSALRSFVPLHLHNSSTFEILVALVWKCRVIAFQPHPTEEMRLLFAVNLRSKLKHLIPAGYYGNAYVQTLAVSTAEELSQNPVSYALELIRNAKNNVTEELVRSLLDFLVTRDRPSFPLNNNVYIVSDWTRAGFGEMDFGWGQPVYSGPSTIAPVFGFHLPFKNKNGENGIMLPVCLPTQSMERFAKELHNMLQYATKPKSAL